MEARMQDTVIVDVQLSQVALLRKVAENRVEEDRTWQPSRPHSRGRSM